MAEISPEILTLLNRGELEARTLAESLAVNFSLLLRNLMPHLPEEVFGQMHAARSEGITRRMAIAGELLHGQLGPGGYFKLARHRSDTVRGWAAYLLAASPDFSLGEQLQLIRILANDHNPGVRECAWLALRPRIAANIEVAIELLEAWTVSTSPFVRRFASEATRPRGVWCRKIDRLVAQPQLGLVVIEPLRADPHRYVQNSVANWLNDAAKSRPAWVRKTCSRWQRESPGAATERICRRGLRSLS